LFSIKELINVKVLSSRIPWKTLTEWDNLTDTEGVCEPTASSNSEC